jgi:hypothetical protein
MPLSDLFIILFDMDYFFDYFFLNNRLLLEYYFLLYQRFLLKRKRLGRRSILFRSDWFVLKKGSLVLKLLRAKERLLFLFGE